jgi:hypothetical protein
MSIVTTYMREKCNVSSHKSKNNYNENRRSTCKHRVRIMMRRRSRPSLIEPGTKKERIHHSKEEEEGGAVEEDQQESMVHVA